MRLNRLLLGLVSAAPLVSLHIFAQASALTFPEVKDLPEQKDLPDVFTMLDGTKVTTKEQWAKRREEMKSIIEFYELGHAPPPPDNLVGEEMKSSDVLGGAAHYRLVHLKFGPEQKLGIEIAIFVPAGKGPFPTIINPSFFSTPGSTNVSTPPRAAVAAANVANTSTNSAGTNATRRPFFGGPVTPESAAHGFLPQLERGYAIVTYRYTQCGSDDTNFLNTTFFPAYPGYDWGVLHSWAWGFSRIVDYVETQPFADKSKIIALGHSRLGKLTMVATALDDRISMGAPAGSSGAGTGAYRFCGPGRGGKEGFEDMTRKFPWYFVARAKDFTGHIYKMPFDAHWFIALTAPRPWIAIEGTDDQNCVPSSVRASIEAARPVYKFLGVTEDRVGANYEIHRHGLTPADWTAALDFADKNLRGMKVDRTFDHFPPDTGSITNAPAAK